MHSTPRVICLAKTNRIPRWSPAHYNNISSTNLSRRAPPSSHISVPSNQTSSSLSSLSSLLLTSKALLRRRQLVFSLLLFLLGGVLSLIGFVSFTSSVFLESAALSSKATAARPHVSTLRNAIVSLSEAPENLHEGEFIFVGGMRHFLFDYQQYKYEHVASSLSSDDYGCYYCFSSSSGGGIGHVGVPMKDRRKTCESLRPLINLFICGAQQLSVFVVPSIVARVFLFVSAVAVADPAPNPPYYTLDKMKGTWYPAYLSQVRAKDPYQYFMIDGNSSAVGTGDSDAAGEGGGGNGVGGERGRKGSMLLTYRQAVSSCEALGGTLLSNMNFANLGFLGGLPTEDTATSGDAEGLVAGEAIWFGFKRRRPQKDVTQYSELDTYTLIDGKPAFYFPLCKKSANGHCPGEKQVLAPANVGYMYSAYATYTSPSFTSDACFTLRLYPTLNESIAERMAPVECGATTYTEEVTYPIRGPPTVVTNQTSSNTTSTNSTSNGTSSYPSVVYNSTKSVTVSRLKYHRALAICQRPFIDLFEETVVPTPNVNPYAPPRTSAPSAILRSPLAPQDRWVRSPRLRLAQTMQPSTAGWEQLLTAEDDLRPQQPKAGFNTAKTPRNASHPLADTLYNVSDDEVYDKGQLVDHVEQTIELFVSPIRVSSPSEGSELCRSMDADLAIIPSANYAADVVFPAVAAVHQSVDVSSRGDGYSKFTGSRFYIGCHAPPGSSDLEYDKTYSLENASLRTVVGSDSVYASGGSESDIRSLFSFSTGGSRSVIVGSSTVEDPQARRSLCRASSSSVTVIDRNFSADDYVWIGFGWGGGLYNNASRTSFSDGTSFFLSNDIDYSDSGALVDIVRMRCRTSYTTGAPRVGCENASASAKQTLCTRQMMRVSAELVDGTDVIAGSTVRLRLTISHILPTFGYVLVAITAPPHLGGLVFSTSVVNFTYAAPNTSRYEVSVGIYIPSSVPVGRRIPVSCHVLYPVGAGVNPTVRWLRSKRDEEDAAYLSTSTYSAVGGKGSTTTSALLSNRPLNSIFVIEPYRVTFSPESLFMSAGEVMSVAATLSRPSRRDFVIASDYTNEFASAPILDFARGSTALTFTVAAKNSTNGEEHILNFTGIPFNTNQPVFGVPSSSVFYASSSNLGARTHPINSEATRCVGSCFSLALTIREASVFTWNVSTGNYFMYDGNGDGLQGTLDLSQSPFQDFTVKLSTNCTPYVGSANGGAIDAIDLRYKAGQSKGEFFEIRTLRQAYYREVTCELVATPSLLTQAAPAPLIYTFRKRISIEIVRFPRHSFSGDSASIILKVDHSWPEMSFVLIITHIGTNCPSQAQTWNVNAANLQFEYQLPNETQPMDCRVDFNTSSSKFDFRRVIYNSTQLNALLPRWVRRVRGTGEAPKASINLLGGGTSTLFAGMGSPILVWIPEGHVLSESPGKYNFSTNVDARYFAGLSSTEVDLLTEDYLLDGGGSFCIFVNGTTNTAFTQFRRMIPVYDHNLRMFHVNFTFVPPSPGGYVAHVLTCREDSVTNTSVWINFGNVAFTVPESPRLGLLLATDAGYLSNQFPSTLIAGTEFAAYVFPTAPMAGNHSFGTLSIKSAAGHVLVDARLYADDPAIPKLRFAVPTTTSATTILVEFSITSGDNTYGMPFRDHVIQQTASFIPYPNVRWAAAPGYYTGAAIRSEFCHTLSFSGSSDVGVNITVIPSHSVDLISILNGSTVTLGPSSPSSSVCVGIVSVSGSFRLVATPFSAGSGTGAPLSVNFTVVDNLRFVRVFPIFGFSRYVLLDRWAVATSCSSTDLPHCTTNATDGGIALEVLTFGEALPEATNVSVRISATYSSSSTASAPFVSVRNASVVVRENTVPAVAYILPTNTSRPYDEGGHFSLVDLCAANEPSASKGSSSSVLSHLNCAQVYVLDPPTYSSVECLVRPDGYVPSFYGAAGYNTSQMGLDDAGPFFALPTATVYIFNNVSREANLSEAVQPKVAGIRDPPLGILFGDYAFSRYSTSTRFLVDAQYAETSPYLDGNFSTLEKITTLSGGGGGRSEDVVSPPVVYRRNPVLAAILSAGLRPTRDLYTAPSTYVGRGYRMDASTYSFQTLSSTTDSGSGSTVEVSCKAGAPVWTVEARRPAFSDLNVTINPGERGAQNGFITVAPPPWYASTEQFNRPITMRLSAVGGTNASIVQFEPNAFSLRFNKTALVPTTQTGEFSPKYSTAINRFRFKMFSNASFDVGAANVSVLVTFSPWSPFYVDYVFDHNVTVVPLMNASATYDPDLHFFGCYDYVLGTFMLQPLPARPISLGLSTNDTRVSITASPNSIYDAFTLVNLTIPSSDCALLEPSTNTNGTSLDFFSLIEFKTLGVNALEYTRPPSLTVRVRKALGVTLSRPSGLFYPNIENAIVLTVEIERMPKPNRTLILRFNCVDVQTNSSADCRANVTRMVFRGEGSVDVMGGVTNTSETTAYILWSVMKVSSYRLWLTAEGWGAPEYNPIRASLDVEATAKKATFFTILGGRDYTHLPAGKSFSYEVSNPYLNPGDRLVATVTANVSNIVTFTNQYVSNEASLSITLTHSNNSANFTVKASSQIPKLTPIQLFFTFTEVSSTTIAQETTPAYVPVTVFPQHIVNFTANSLYFYHGTTNQNIITFSAPQPYNSRDLRVVTTTATTTAPPHTTTAFLTTTSGTTPSDTTTTTTTTTTVAPRPPNAFGPILEVYFSGFSNSVETNFSSSPQINYYQQTLWSTQLTLNSYVKERDITNMGSFQVCWARQEDATTDYAFEYSDMYVFITLGALIPSQCLTFTIYTQSLILVSVDSDWYFRDTLVIIVAARAEDLNRCRRGTTVQVRTTNPSLSFTWLRNGTDFVASGPDGYVKAQLTALITNTSTTKGLNFLNWDVVGTCFNFIRDANSTKYTVHEPSIVRVKGFPNIIFLEETVEFSVAITVEAFHDASENQTQLNIEWLGVTDAAVLSIPGSQAAVLSPTGVANKFITRFPKALSITITYQIRARKPQLVYRSWKWSVEPVRDRYIGAFTFPPEDNAGSSFIIPDLQQIAMNSTSSAVRAALRNPEGTLYLVVFAGEHFCITATRSNLSYGVVYTVSVIQNTSVFEVDTNVRSFTTSADVTGSFCFTVNSVAQWSLQQILFSTHQTHNLYYPISNITLNVTGPTIVRITNGTFQELVCDSANYRLIEIKPDLPPKRDDVRLNFTWWSPQLGLQQTFFLSWTVSSSADIRRYINLSIPCTASVAGDVPVYVTQAFDSKEFAPVPAEASFTFILKPRGTFVIRNLRPLLFESQTLILEVSPTQAPVQSPVRVRFGFEGVLVEPDSLTWQPGAMASQRIELFGNIPTGVKAPVVLRTEPRNTEYEDRLQCFLPAQGGAPAANTTCEMAVVPNVKLQPSRSELIVFVGYPQTFILNVVECTNDAAVSFTLLPFEYQDTIEFSPRNFNFTCRLSASLPSWVVTVTGQSNPAVPEQRTQVLIISQQSLSGAAPFSNVNALGVNIEVRTPAPITVDVSSGTSLFVGRVTNISVILPRLPSKGSVVITPKADDSTIVQTGPPLVFTSDASSPRSMIIELRLVQAVHSVGYSLIELIISGEAATEFFFTASSDPSSTGVTGGAPLSPFSSTRRLLRQMPFEVVGSEVSILRKRKFIQNISYPYNITIQQAPQVSRDQIEVTMRFISRTTPSTVYTYSVFFEVNMSRRSFNFLLPFSGEYAVSGTVAGSQSYADTVRTLQDKIVVGGKLEITVDPIATTQYMNSGLNNIQSASVYIPQLNEPHYRVVVTPYWDSSSVAACARASAEIVTSNFAYDVTNPDRAAQVTRVSFFNNGQSNIRCSLYLSVSGSEEFSKTPVLIGSVLFLPLNSILTPPAPADFSLLVGASIQFVLNVSSVPPEDIIYPIGPSSANLRGVVVTPRFVNITSSGVPFAVFTIQSTAEGIVTIPFSCRPISTTAATAQLYTFEENKNLDVTIRTLSLLEPTYASNGVAYRPILEGQAPTAEEEAANTLTVYVGSANAVMLNVTFPLFYKYNAPALIRVMPSTSNATYLAATFAVGGGGNGGNGADPTITLLPTMSYPYSAVLTITGNLAGAGQFASPRREEVIVSIDSSTREYRAISRIRVRILPLYYFKLSTSFVRLYSGAENAGSLFVKPNCTEWPPELRGKAVTISLSSACTYLAYDRSRSLTSCDAQRLAITASGGGGGGGTCTLGAAQSTFNTVPLFTSDAATIDLTVIQQPEVSLQLYAGGRLLAEGSGVTAEQVRTQGITIRLLSKSVGFASTVLVTPFNESAVTIASTTSNRIYFGLPYGSGGTGGSSSQNAVAPATTTTGFWRALSTAMNIDLNLDGSSRYGFADVVRDITQNNNRSTIRWSISASTQRDEMTIQISALPTYSTDRDEVIAIRCKHIAFIDGAYPHPQHDVVSFKITADVKESQLLVKKEDAANTVFASAAISAVMSSHSATSSILALTVVTLSRCPNPQWKQTQDTMDFFMFPLRSIMPFLEFSEGNSEDLGTYAGAIIGNTLLVVFCALLQLIVIGILHVMKVFDTYRGIKELLATMKFPSLCWFPLLLIYSPTVVASVRVLLYSASSAFKVIASFSLLVYVIIIPAAAILLTTKSYTLTFHPPLRKGLWAWLLNEGYYKHPADSTWMGRYGEVLTPLRGEARWFFAADVVLMAVVSFAVGVAPESESQCLVRNIFLCLSFFFVFFGFLLIQPMSRKADNFFFALVALLQASTVAIMASQRGGKTSSSSSASSSASSGGTAESATTTTPQSTTTGGGGSDTGDSSSQLYEDFFGSTDLDVVAQNLLLATAVLCLARALLQWAEAFLRWASQCSSLHHAAAHEAIFGDDDEGRARGGGDDKAAPLLLNAGGAEGGSQGRNKKDHLRRSDGQQSSSIDNNKNTRGNNSNANKRSGGAGGGGEYAERTRKRRDLLRSTYQRERFLMHDSDLDDDDEDEDQYEYGNEDYNDHEDEDEDGYGHSNKMMIDFGGGGSGVSNYNSPQRYQSERYRRQRRRMLREEGIAAEPLDYVTEDRLRELRDEALATVYDIELLPADALGSPQQPNTRRGRGLDNNSTTVSANKANSARIKYKGFQRAFDPTVLAFDSSLRPQAHLQHEQTANATGNPFGRANAHARTNNFNNNDNASYFDRRGRPAAVDAGVRSHGHNVGGVGVGGGVAFDDMDYDDDATITNLSGWTNSLR